MSEKWYVVHVTTSFEDTVKRYIFEQMKLDNCPGLISDVLVPTETLEEQLKGGKKKKIEKKFFPGYLLVKTELNNDSWHFLRNIPKVIGFVGGKIRDGKLDPDSVPTVEQSEIDKMRNMNIYRYIQDMVNINYCLRKGSKKDQLDYDSAPVLEYSLFEYDPDHLNLFFKNRQT